MTAKTTKNVRPQRAETRLTEPATAAAVAPATSVAPTKAATAPASTDHHAASRSATAASCNTRLRGVPPRHRRLPSAEPLAKFRAKGVATWDKAQTYEWIATFCVAQFGLLDTEQLGEWVFKDLATAGARHRQAQTLTLRLCPQARAGSSAQRLATAGHRPVLRTLGRKKVGKRFHYYLNARGLRYMTENFGLALPDASKALTTASDMTKRALVFEHCLALYRTDKDLAFVGPAALAAEVDRQQTLEPLLRALLSCLANLWCTVAANGRVQYTYVADRPGSSNGTNVAHYRELAKAASLLGRAADVEVIGRRMPTEAGCALNHTQLAKSVAAAAANEVFWTKDKRYRVEKLVAFFASLKPHAERIRMLMERHCA